MITFNINMLYIYKFISQCLPIYAFYTILFIKRGQSITDIALLLAFWSAFTILFEIPSGVLSDRWNRRNMLALSSLFQGLCFIVWFFSSNFLMFMIGFIFWSIALAFSSGTEEGLIYDNLRYDQCEDMFTKIYGRAQFYANVGSIVGIASAGMIINFVSIETILLISIFACFINILVISQIREKNYYSHQAIENNISFFETLKDTLNLIKSTNKILIYILFLIFLVSIASYLDEFDALIINDFLINEIWVSIILTVRFIFIALGNVLAPVVQKKLDTIQHLFLLNGLAYILLYVFATIWNQFAIFIFGFAIMIMSITEILLVNAMQEEIREAARSTIMSFYSIGQNIVMIAFSISYAYLSGIFPLQCVYIIIAVYGIIASIVFMIYNP